MMAILIFNKQFRAEEKIFSELKDKIKKSQNFAVSVKKDAEIYHLDTIDISMDTVTCKLVVKDKAGNEVYILDCKYTGVEHELQTARFHKFSALLEFARKNKEKIDATKIKQTEKAKKAVVAAQNAKAKREEALELALAALKRMKGL